MELGSWCAGTGGCQTASCCSGVEEASCQGLLHVQGSQPEQEKAGTFRLSEASCQGHQWQVTGLPSSETGTGGRGYPSLDLCH